MRWTLIGHDEQKKLFERLSSERALSHAYLFHGPQGVGKRLFALNVAGSLLGVESVVNNPDATCLAPSVSKETGKLTDIPIEIVRELKTWAYRRPLYGEAKVVLIDDADRLSDPAANTLLKVLEEPPSYLYFFLITSLPGSIMQTIASRCQDIRFAPLDVSHTTQALAGLKIDVNDRELLRAVAEGRPGMAISLVHANRLPEVTRAIALLKKLLSSGVAERLVIAKAITEEDVMHEVVGWWLSWIHTQLNDHPHYAPIAYGLIELASVVTEPKYNRRLALEKFLLELPS